MNDAMLRHNAGRVRDLLDTDQPLVGTLRDQAWQEARDHNLPACFGRKADCPELRKPKCMFIGVCRKALYAKEAE